MKHQHRAIEQRYRTARVGDISTRERAWLPCGCALYVGRDIEGNPATRSSACREQHTLVVERANSLLREMQTSPKPGRTAVTACRIALSQAAKELI